MHPTSWRKELFNLLSITALAGLLGWPFGAAAWFACGVLLVYSVWLMLQLGKLSDWLSDDDNDLDPPESKGAWGEVLDDIYRLRRANAAREEKLRGMVHYLRDSFSSLAFATIMVDRQGNIEWCNEAAETLVGLRAKDDVGQQLLNLARDPKFVDYFEGEVYDEPLIVSSPLNPELSLELYITFFGNRSRLIIGRDVTHVLRLEQMRKDFVGNVSHELRTPLTVINGYIDTFIGLDELAPPIQRGLQQMQQQSWRMQSLINDLITLTRLETVPEESTQQERIDLRVMLEALREETLLSAEGERTLLIECDEQAALMGHRNELRSAFSNLMVNAAKYTRPGDSITVRWYCDERFAYLEVEDSGAGIEAHHLPRLTERFYRVDKSRQSGTGGTGLGLAIVKHVLLRHQAELKIESQVGRGTLCRCQFPLSRVVQR